VNNPAQASVPLLKIQDVAKRLNCSASAVYHLAQIGDLPAIRFGGLVRVRPSDLEKFIQDCLQGQAE